MKYMLLFCGTVAEDEAFNAMPDDQRKEEYGLVMEWFTKYGANMEDGYQLQPVSLATTVRRDPHGKPVITDGPYAESGEVVGGYTIMKAQDLDEVLAAAKEWPAGPVEIRPVVERS